MTTRPVSARTGTARLRRSIPFWLLLAGSLASFGYGGWLVLDKVSTMTATLTDGSATGVEVYAGQSWIVVGGAFLGAGLIGLVTVLALAVVSALLPAVAAPGEAEAPLDDDAQADADVVDDPALVDAETDEAPETDEALGAAADSPAADELPEAVPTGR